MNSEDYAKFCQYHNIGSHQIGGGTFGKPRRNYFWKLELYYNFYTGKYGMTHNGKAAWTVRLWNKIKIAKHL